MSPSLFFHRPYFSVSQRKERKGEKEGRKEGFESARRRRRGRLETEPTFSRCTVSKQSLENMETTMLLATAASTDRGNNRSYPSFSSLRFALPLSSLPLLFSLSHSSSPPRSSSTKRRAKSNEQ